MRYHINDKGIPGPCEAKRLCPFGDLVADHYSSVTEATEAFEAKMRDALTTSLNGLKPSATVALENLIPLDVLRADIRDGFVAVRPHEDDPDLKILCYSKETQFAGHWTEATKTARGLIIRSKDPNFSDSIVLERPWRKFFTLEQINGNEWVLGDEEREGSSVEAEIGRLDLSAPAEVMDKADGSLGILYRHPDGGPALSTKGSFGSDQANYYTAMLRANKKLEEAADGLLTEDAHRTHLFELVGPENRVVVGYDQDDILLLGMVEKETGKYLSPLESAHKWEPGTPEIMPAMSVAEAFSLPDRPNREGVVIRVLSDDPKKQMQLKVKQDDYKALHRVLTEYSVDDLRWGLRNSTATWEDLLKTAETGDVEDLPGLASVYTIDIDHPAVHETVEKRKAQLTTAVIPRLRQLKAAKDYFDAIDPKFFEGEDAPRRFSAKVKAEAKGLELDTYDVYKFYNLKRQGVDPKDFSAQRMLWSIAQDLKANTGLLVEE